MADDNNSDITSLTVQLLSAFVSKNTVSSEGLADLIKTTRAALMQDLAPPAPQEAEEYVPAVSVRKSIASPDHIISLIDGRSYKTLKRHLAKHNLTPQQYRERYKLPKSYPMVSPSYSEARRAVAERLGLGRKPNIGAARAKAPSPAPAAPAVTDVTAPVSAPAPANKAAKKPAVKAATAPAAATDAQTGKGKVAAVAKAPARKRLSISMGKQDKSAALETTTADAAGGNTPKTEALKMATPKAQTTKPKPATKAVAKSKAPKPSLQPAKAAVTPAKATADAKTSSS